METNKHQDPIAVKPRREPEFPATTPGTKEYIARKFSLNLWHSLTVGEMLEIIARNFREEDPAVCHSHDFTDPNMDMLNAFEAAFPGARISDIIDSERLLKLWHEAWTLARNYHFFLETEAERDGALPVLQEKLAELDATTKLYAVHCWGTLRFMRARNPGAVMAVLDGDPSDYTIAEVPPAQGCLGWIPAQAIEMPKA